MPAVNFKALCFGSQYFSLNETNLLVHKIKTGDLQLPLVISNISIQQYINGQGFEVI